MQVTDVRVRRVEKEGKMKAIVSITLDNEFVIVISFHEQRHPLTYYFK